MAKEILDSNFDSLINSSKPILVDFWAEWCGPCKQLSPILDEISQEMSSVIEIYKCNIDQNPESPSKYGVRAIPTLAIFVNGKMVGAKVGVLPKSSLKTWIEGNL